MGLTVTLIPTYLHGPNSGIDAYLLAWA